VVKKRGVVFDCGAGRDRRTRRGQARQLRASTGSVPRSLRWPVVMTRHNVHNTAMCATWRKMRCRFHGKKSRLVPRIDPSTPRSCPEHAWSVEGADTPHGSRLHILTQSACASSVSRAPGDVLSHPERVGTLGQGPPVVDVRAVSGHPGTV